ncbi:MAG TPA: ABC transporter ATP-binding protein [Chloroflexota bacterium]|nr:ABC transporter ATP-binding protein [Chloroflexota bacterium]
MTPDAVARNGNDPDPAGGLDLVSPALHTIELAKRYRHVTALAGLTMSVPRGEVFGFLGPNGAGKTTAVKLLVGLTRPTAGEGWVLGEPIGDRATRRRIGYLPELFRYQDWMSAREVLRLHCRLAGIDRQQWEAEVAHALDTVGLAERAADRVGTFSKGMQQRLGLAVALLGRPELVFLDEPTSALDPVGRHDVRIIVRELKLRGTTVFLNSHLLSEVEQVCDRVAVIDRGRVIALGTLDELRGGVKIVRLRVAGAAGMVEPVLARFGQIEPDGDWYVVRGTSGEAVPEMVDALVGAGVRIYAIEPSSQTLEDRFLQLLGGQSEGTAIDRARDRALDPA